MTRPLALGYRQGIPTGVDLPQQEGLTPTSPDDCADREGPGQIDPGEGGAKPRAFGYICVTTPTEPPADPPVPAALPMTLAIHGARAARRASATALFAKAAITSYAQREGYDLAQILCDTEYRPPRSALDALIDAAHHTDITAVITPDLTHLTADVDTRTAIRHRIQTELGVPVIATRP